MSDGIGRPAYDGVYSMSPSHVCLRFMNGSIMNDFFSVGMICFICIVYLYITLCCDSMMISVVCGDVDPCAMAWLYPW